MLLSRTANAQTRFDSRPTQIAFFCLLERWYAVLEGHGEVLDFFGIILLLLYVLIDTRVPVDPSVNPIGRTTIAMYYSTLGRVGSTSVTIPGNDRIVGWNLDDVSSEKQRPPTKFCRWLEARESMRI